MAAESTQVKLIVGGREFSRWQRYEVESDLLQPADAFSFTAPNDEAALAGVINYGDACKVEVDGALVMTGYVDDVSYSTDAQGATVEVSGRDRFGFLVDCSAEPQGLANQTLLTLAQKLGSPWIVVWEADSKITLPLSKKMKVEPGESPIDVLQRFATKAKVLIWATADGKGHIGRPDYTQAPKHQLRLYARSNPLSAKHNNVLRSQVVRSWREQFSRITAMGSTGNTSSNSGTSSRSKAQAASSTITTTRPLILTDGDLVSYQQAKDRAELERDRRAFEGERLEMMVAGHYGRPAASGGAPALYQQGELADVIDEAADVNGSYLITRRRFRGEASGRFTELTLHPAGVWMA